MRAIPGLTGGDIRQRALPYLKPSLPDTGPADIVVRDGQAPVLKNLANGLLIAYLIDLGDKRQYFQHHHLEATGVTEGELHIHAVHNLMALAREAPRRIIREGICGLPRG
jgi:hypothetical protein